MALLEVRDVSVRYTPRDQDPHDAVRGVSFEVEPGEFVGLVGESGSGKSTLGNAILQLLDKPAKQVGGSVVFDGRDLSTLGDDELRRLRWVRLSTVFQSSMNSLNPVITIGEQFAETFRAHPDAEGSGDEKARAAELLEMVSLDAHVLKAYPHELSGGMKQRVALALALALHPRLVVLDEPTTGLDVLVQRRILDRLRELQGTFGFAVLFISHDIGTVLEIADRVLVMYRGEIVEENGARQLLAAPQHEYTQKLLGAYAASRETALRRTAEHDDTLLEVTGLSKRYATGRGRTKSTVQALDDVSLRLRTGRVTALVGQSGSGKSTLARILIGIERPDAGSVVAGGVHVESLRGRALRDYRQRAQYVFQDPYSSLNPTRTVAYTLSRPLVNYGGVSGKDVRLRAEQLLEQVGLTPASRFIDKLPHQLSGGQRQRVVIARALAPNPEILVADEPVSSLDVSIRAEILELLRRLVDERDLGMLYITHDLLSARSLAHETIVLENGRVVESGPTEQVTDAPQHEYTRELLAAIPDPLRRNIA